MAVLTIKKLPGSLHEALKQEAMTEGRSLNSFILAALESTIEERRRLRRMRAHRRQLEDFVASLPPSSNATNLIRGGRSRR